MALFAQRQPIDGGHLEIQNRQMVVARHVGLTDHFCTTDVLDTQQSAELQMKKAARWSFLAAFKLAYGGAGVY